MKPIVIFFGVAFIILAGALMVLSEDSKASYIAYYNLTNETVGDNNFRWNSTEQVMYVNGSVLLNGVLVCLMDGTNCPNLSGNASQGPAGTNGTDGVGIKNIYVLSNDSIQINLTNGTNITSGNLTGQKGDTGATGSQGSPGIAGSNGTGVLNVTILSNGSLQVGLTNGSIVVLGNITGTKGDSGSNGVNGSFVNGSDAWVNNFNVTTLNANIEDGGVNFSNIMNAQGLELSDTDDRFTSIHPWGIETGGQIAGGTLAIADNSFDYFASYTVDGVGYSGFNTGGYDNYLFYVEGSNGVNPGHPTFSVDSRTNTTTAERLHVNTTLNVTTEIYVGNAVVCRSDGTNCPSGGNSSWNEAYANGIFYRVSNGTLDNRTFNQTLTDSLYVLKTSLPGAVGQNLTYALIAANMGNWSADKASYATNAHVANVNSTALKNGTVASLAGLTVTSDATVEGVLVVDPGIASATAVRVGGPLTTYSALQFQSDTSNAKDFIYASENASGVMTNKMTLRVSGTESSGDAGQDFQIMAFDDAGNFKGTILTAKRSNLYVGIGDATPDAKLDVVGDTILDGGVTISGVTSIEGYRVLPSWTNYTTSQYATTSATVYTLMPTLTTTLAASHTYLVKCEFLTFAAAATTGERLRVNTTGAPTTVTWSFNSQVSATTRTSFKGVSTSTNAFADTGSAGTNVRDVTFLTGYIVTSGSASTITYEMISEVAGSNAAYDTGSWCEYKVVA